MGVLRVEKNTNYSTMCNEHLKDMNLSLKAKGLLSIMLSLPDEWHYSVKGLKAICRESINTINGILQELEENGYLLRNRIYCNGKISEWEYVIFESKEKKKLYLENLDIKNEDIENQDIENQDIENEDVYKYTKQLSTKESNTNKSSTKEYIPYKEVIDCLNHFAGTHYKYETKKTMQLIKARFNEGFTLLDFQTVIKKKCDEWIGTKYEMYLKPDTLFGTKFEGYLNQRIVKQSKQSNNPYLDWLKQMEAEENDG